MRTGNHMKTHSRWLCLLWATFCILAMLAHAHEESSPSQQLAVVVADSTAVAAADEGPIVRCRVCGAKVALKKDHMELHDASKSVGTRHSHELGEKGAQIHTFVNPSRVEMELVAFKKAIGVEAEMFTNKATFFDGYNWRDLRCGGCNRHVGWKFHHDDFQNCIQNSIMESVSAKAQQEITSASTMEMAKKEQRARKELEGQCITATAGWWTYEVCYNKEVRQYHEEPDGTRPSDWSMGVFVPQGAGSVMGTEIAQYFAGGQRCDENGELRNTKVVFTCCKSKPQTLTIENVEEPSLCSYLITVCVPSLCSKSKEAEVPYNTKEIADTCAATFAKTHHETPAIPAAFAALRWSTVISEDSSELDWARNMELKT